MTSLFDDAAGGYVYDFVNSPSDNLVCKICHCPSREPHLTVCCGHTFCNSCVKNVKKSTFINDACPMCRSDQFTTVPNKRDERDVLSLRVHCTNAKRGCDWIGEVNDISNHLKIDNGCKFEDVHCPNSCGKTLERQYLTAHAEKCPRRLINCEHCHIGGEHQFIEGSHKEKCCKLPVPCPNKCEMINIPRENLKEHIKVCPLEIVHCQYHNIGCEAKVAREDVVKHEEEKMRKHLSLMKSALTDSQNKLSDTQSKLAEAQNKFADAQSKLVDVQRKLDHMQYTLDHELDDTKDKLAEIKQTLVKKLQRSHVEVLYEVEDKLADTEQTLKDKLHNHTEILCEVQDRLTKTEQILTEEIHSSHVEALYEVEDKLAYTEQTLEDKIHSLHTEILCKVQDRLTKIEQTLTEKIQRNHTEVLDMFDYTEQTFEDKLQANHTEVLVKVDNKLSTAQKRINELEITLQQKSKPFDVMFGKWAVKIHTQAAKLLSCDQVLPVIVKVSDFEMNKQTKYDWNSHPFYTYHQGYRIKLTVVLAGRGLGQGHHVSVYLYIMDGPFDHVLKWKLKGKFDVKLLNQFSDSSHLSVSHRIYADRSQSKPFWYSDEFISHVQEK